MIEISESAESALQFCLIDPLISLQDRKGGLTMFECT